MSQMKVKNCIAKVKAKKEAFILGLGMFLLNLPVTVYADDPFAKTENLANQATTKVQGISLALFTVAAVVAGLCYGLGGQEMKQKMKKHAGSIIIAVIVVAAAPAFLVWLKGFIGG